MYLAYTVYENRALLCSENSRKVFQDSETVTYSIHPTFCSYDRKKTPRVSQYRKIKKEASLNSSAKDAVSRPVTSLKNIGREWNHPPTHNKHEMGKGWNFIWGGK
jgi:hypothetical protein